MGEAYRIRCRYCGATFAHYFRPNRPSNGDISSYSGYIETQMAMRCPRCHKKLNNTAEEFNSQIEVAYRYL